MPDGGSVNVFLVVCSAPFDADHIVHIQTILWAHILFIWSDIIRFFSGSGYL